MDLKRLRLELESQDETVRAKAVRGLCPCHAGWDAFEKLIGVVLRLMQDSSPAVRGNALHGYHDAVRIQRLRDCADWLDAVEEVLGRKLASDSRKEEAGFRVRRCGSGKRRRGGFVTR